MSASETEPRAMTSCEDVVNEIRRDEFGVGVELGEEARRLMKVRVVSLSWIQQSRAIFLKWLKIN